jgi:hypothetical protein
MMQKQRGFGVEMSAFDAKNPTIDPSNSSPFASLIPNRDVLDVVSDRLRLAESQSHPLESSPFRFP